MTPAGAAPKDDRARPCPTVVPRQRRKNSHRSSLTDPNETCRHPLVRAGPIRDPAARAGSSQVAGAGPG